MLNFQCDYLEGCHPKILEKLAETNNIQMPGYDNDPYCGSAREKIRRACGAPEADVHFLAGGTQTNLTVISAILRPHQGVLAAAEGHIACHETGAIEATGHKVLTLQPSDGKISASQIEEYCKNDLACSIREHMVQPGMVYLSFPTESGTLYNRKELKEISSVCRRYGLPLYLDGAKMGYGLSSPSNDLSLADIAELCDVFYIGGTKCGALFGEAVVISNDSLKRDFRYFIKQKGAMLAKGWLLGLQFDVLFEDGLYSGICAKAVNYAQDIRRAFEHKGIPMFGNSVTNQQFPILNKEQMEAFHPDFEYEVWGKYDESHMIVRFVTSWATTEEEAGKLIEKIHSIP